MTSDMLELPAPALLRVQGPTCMAYQYLQKQDSQGTLLRHSSSSLESALPISRVQVLLAAFPPTANDLKLNYFVVTVTKAPTNHHFAHETPLSVYK